MRLIQPDDLGLAVETLETGGLVVVPTRRWYMLCADASDQEACDRIFAAKRRPASKSLALILPNAEAATELFAMTSHAQRLAAAFWPGDLAMILPWRDPAMGQQHSAVGVPSALVTCDSGVLGDLAARSRTPIAATTVNISTNVEPGPAITTAEVERFVAHSGIDVTYCIDGRICPIANHLTVVDCSTADTEIVRSGVVHLRAINAAIGTDTPTPTGPPRPAMSCMGEASHERSTSTPKTG